MHIIYVDNYQCKYIFLKVLGNNFIGVLRIAFLFNSDVYFNLIVGYMFCVY